MGRDTSISIVRKVEYQLYVEQLVKLKKMEDLDWYDEFDHACLMETIDMTRDSYEKENLLYWGKSECNEVVKFFRTFKLEDGDFTITTQVLDKLVNTIYIHPEKIMNLREILKSNDMLLIFNTN